MRSARSRGIHSDASTAKSFAAATAMRALKLAGRKGRSSSASRTLASSLKRVRMRCSNSRRKFDLGIADQRENRIALTDLSQRGGCAGPQVWPARERRLGDDVSGRGAIDEVGVGQHGRALKHCGGCFRLVRRQREDQADAALRWRGTKLPPAPCEPGPRGRPAAPSSPARPRRAPARSDRNGDRRVRARSPRPRAPPRRRIAPRREIGALCLAWRSQARRKRAGERGRRQ